MKTAVVIFWEGYLDVAPTIVEWIRYLAEKGIKVKVYISDRDGNRSKVSESFDKELVDTENISCNGWLEQLTRRVVNNRILWRIMPSVARELDNLLFSRSIGKFAIAVGKRKESYDVAYCVDATGLYCYRQSGMRADRTVNISLEISEDLSGSGEKIREIKRVEREMLRKDVDLVIIQDRYRAALLERSLGYPFSEFAFLPNSARKNDTAVTKGDYFHRLFHINRSDKIVLSAGMIADSVCSLELATALGNWDTDLPVKIVFHERLEIPGNRSYYNRVKAAGRGKVLLSLKPVPFEELAKIFSSADIGLAIYSKSHGDNFGVIGSASGKLFQYIKYGTPVIASDLPGLRELVVENGLGVVVDGPEQVPQAIGEVIGNWDQYSRNARKAFQEQLNMDIYLEHVYQTIYN